MMGWCSGTEVFDAMADKVLKDDPVDPERLLLRLVDVLEEMDWDCQCDSAYWEHPLVQEIMRERHPNWFEEDK